MLESKKIIPFLLVVAALAIGGMSSVQVASAGDAFIPLAPQCNCRNPNVGTYGILAPDPNAPGEQRCEYSDTCWVPLQVE